MKFEIYEETVKEEKVTKLRLVEDSFGSIRIVVVDDEGKPLDGGYIASILSNGTLLLFRSVNSKLGFQLDEDGNIIVEKEVS